MWPTTCFLFLPFSVIIFLNIKPSLILVFHFIVLFVIWPMLIENRVRDYSHVDNKSGVRIANILIARAPRFVKGKYYVNNLYYAKGTLVRIAFICVIRTRVRIVHICAICTSAQIVSIYKLFFWAKMARKILLWAWPMTREQAPEI